jgi:hypothetical protein
MSAALDHTRESAINPPQLGDEPLATTLLELVEAVTDASNNESEVVATINHMLRSGQIRLTGCFRDTPSEAFGL